MEQKKIPFKGINRCFDDGISQDGYCMELINARIRNGSIEPIPAPVHIADLPSDAEKVYYHTIAKRVLIISTDRSVTAYNESYQEEQILSNELTGTNHIEFIGNVAIFFLEDTTKYCIFKEGAYTYLGEKPEVPRLVFSPFGKTFSNSPDAKFLVGRDSDGLTHDEFMASMTYALSGLYDNCIDSANKQGCFFGAIFAIAALRMYDGSYLSYSPVYMVEANNNVSVSLKCGQSTTQKSVTMNSFNMFDCAYVEMNNTSKRYSRVETVIYAMNPNLQLGYIDTHLKSWSNLITAIDVFVAPFSFAVKGEAKDRSGVSFDHYSNIRWDEKKEMEAIGKACIFYKYAEYNLEGVQQWILDDVSTDSLALEPTLSLSSMYNPVAANISYVYNNRLHVSHYRQYFPNKYLYNPNDNRYEKGDSNETSVHYYFYIRTDEANSIIHYQADSPYRFINPYISYYDNRAYKVLVAWQSEGKWYGKEFNLTKHNTINLSYYLHKDEDVREGRYGSSTVSYTMASCIDLSTFPVINSLPQEQTLFIIKHNILKVSAISNPFVFPADQTYQPSNADIVGLCSNTQAISQGQFGQHPLYVFTRDGIYAMSVDASGSIVYTAITPVSRDVCINTSSIKGIDSSVLFATSRGLMAIAGGTVTLLSADLDGYLPSCIDSSPLLPKIAAIASMDDKLSKTEFHNYLDGYLAISIAYIYATREIIISNRLYTYSYIYNLDSSTWSKVDYVIQQTTNHYPETYAILRHADGTLHLKDLHNPYRTVSKILVLTKSIKMGTNSHKRVLQSALRALVHPAQSDLYFRGEPVMFRDEQVDIFSNIGLYVLGSNDAEHFELLHGKESIKDVRDLVTKMNKTRAYKYFMIALAGGVRTDVSINYMEFLIDDAYTNRLR